MAADGPALKLVNSFPTATVAGRRLIPLGEYARQIELRKDHDSRVPRLLRTINAVLEQTSEELGLKPHRVTRFMTFLADLAGDCKPKGGAVVEGENGKVIGRAVRLIPRIREGGREVVKTQDVVTLAVLKIGDRFIVGGLENKAGEQLDSPSLLEKDFDLAIIAPQATFSLIYNRKLPDVPRGLGGLVKLALKKVLSTFKIECFGDNSFVMPLNDTVKCVLDLHDEMRSAARDLSGFAPLTGA